MDYLKAVDVPLPPTLVAALNKPTTLVGLACAFLFSQLFDGVRMVEKHPVVPPHSDLEGIAVLGGPGVQQLAWPSWEIEADSNKGPSCWTWDIG